MNRHLTFAAVALATALGVGAVIPLSQPVLGQAGTDSGLSRDSGLRDPKISALGNPKGDVTIIEYFDYQYPYCRKVDPELKRVVQEDGKVRVVFKE